MTKRRQRERVISSDPAASPGDGQTMNLWRRCRAWLMHRLWYVHPRVVLLANTSPAVTLNIIRTAAKPSTQRLHLRQVFARGRRYDILPHDKGFVMTTTHKVAWRYKRRTQAAAEIRAQFVAVGDITQIRLVGRIKTFYLLDTFFIPLFTTSIVIFMPWTLAGQLILLSALFALSWFGHRFNARLEAHEMVYFLERALADFQPRPETLGQPGPEVVYDFTQAWERFYEEQVERER